MDPMEKWRPVVADYLAAADWSAVPAIRGRTFTVTPLARGEYNLNYLLTDDDAMAPLVFRLNRGTQIGRDDQIVYEYNALRLLEDSGVTPRPHAVDDAGARDWFGRGILIMEYLPGTPLDYRRDLRAAARLFAKIHRVPVPEATNPLIREDAPLSIIYEECAGLLDTYFQSDLADPEIRRYLRDLIAWMDAARSAERFLLADPWLCIVNTEVNANNFIANRAEGTLHLVDWEMPRWGDPTSDLAHFRSPLTTLWKTDYRMTGDDREQFLKTYTDAVGDAHLRDTLDERMRLREPFVLLRGISWSAYGWVAYQTDFSGVKNPDTWEVLNRYLDLGFIRSLFDPILARAPDRFYVDE